MRGNKSSFLPWTLEVGPKDEPGLLRLKVYFVVMADFLLFFWLSYKITQINQVASEAFPLWFKGTINSVYVNLWPNGIVMQLILHHFLHPYLLLRVGSSISSGERRGTQGDNHRVTQRQVCMLNLTPTDNLDCLITPECMFLSRGKKTHSGMKKKLVKI